MHLPCRTNKVPTVREFGCTRCQAFHVREIDPELYEQHLYFQSKHGWRERPATLGEQFAIEMRRD
jgi:hypothetical protein